MVRVSKICVHVFLWAGMYFIPSSQQSYQYFCDTLRYRLLLISRLQCLCVCVRQGVTFVSENVDEAAVVNRLPLYEAIIEEGDAMYNPPYWLHAVGTPPGLSISIANRIWQDFLVPRDPTTYYWDMMYKIQFPQFAAKVALTKIKGKLFGIHNKHTSLTMRTHSLEEGYVPSPGVLPIID